MTLEIRRNQHETTIAVVGRLDTFTAPVLQRMIEQHARTAHSIVLEMSGLEYISDAGLHVLAEAHKRMQAVGALRLSGVSEPVMETLKTTGYVGVLAIN